MTVPTVALAQSGADVFSDGANGAKVHVGSGFVCPAKIGDFERDAVGETDPGQHVDFCAYSALDGVYGTVTLRPLSGAYDAKAALAPQFAEQEGIGDKMIAEGNLKLERAKGQAPILVYTRSYETASLADRHYRILYSGAAVGNWAVEATIEYADPHDADFKTDFLNAIYDAHLGEASRSRP
jgi:hypothetical protein